MAGFFSKTFSQHDDYMTPKSAWVNIKNFIPTDKIIWEAFYGDGASGDYLKELGFNVIHENEDFFENNKGEVCCSNPPFTLKKKVVQRLVQLDKPFILIMPVNTMTTGYMRELFKDKNKLQIIVPRTRIQFDKIVDGKKVDLGKKSCNFDCFYYCYKMNLDKDITFLE